MTKEEAKDFLFDMFNLIGTTAIEYWTEKDAEKMRQAVATVMLDTKDAASDTISRQAALRTDCFGDGHEGLRAFHSYQDYMKMRKYLKSLPSTQPEITDGQAVEHLQASGWMQNHDKQMYEMGLRERLADDSDSYDALLPSAQPEPCEDAVNRQAIFDTAAEYEKQLCEILGDENELVEVVKILKHRLIALPPVQPEQKIGKFVRWMEKRETTDYILHQPHCKCSLCGNELLFDNINYCYICGARLIEDREAERRKEGTDVNVKS